MSRLPGRPKVSVVSTLVLIAVMVAALFLAVTIQPGLAQTSTNITGVIFSNTTWTKAGSPYSLAGPTAVGIGVTLTIEPGVTVNLNGLYIQVNGTLVAMGSETEPISFNGGATYEKYTNCINFTQYATGWDEQSSSGSIIENAVLSSAVVYINNMSPKINQNSIQRLYVAGGSPVISNNTIIDYVNYDNNAITVVDGTPLIFNNSKIGGIYIMGGSPVISNNFITSSGNVDQNYAAIYISSGSPEISNNTIISRVDRVEGHIMIPNTSYIYPGIVLGGTPHIYGNTISGCSTGIKGSGTTGAITIERNLIANNSVGVEVGSNVIIRNNTITNNSVAIQNPSPSSTFIDNNIQNNTRSVSLATASNVDVTYNWWGTTDISAINQTMYDVKYDFNLGVVNFIPFLNEPNPEAPAVPAMPSSTPTPSPPTTATPTPTPTPTQTAIPVPTSTPIQSTYVRRFRLLPARPQLQTQQLSQQRLRQS